MFDSSQPCRGEKPFGAGGLGESSECRLGAREKGVWTPHKFKTSENLLETFWNPVVALHKDRADKLIMDIISPVGFLFTNNSPLKPTTRNGPKRWANNT
jgi:hypothetical protein